MTEISLKSLPKDLINLVSGIVEENVEKKMLAKSRVYALYEFDGKGHQYTTLNYVNYFSQNIDNILNIMKQHPYPYTYMKLGYSCFMINPLIDIGGVFVFTIGSHILEITNEKERAEELFENYKDALDSRGGSKNDSMEDFFVSFEDEGMIYWKQITAITSGAT